MGLYEVPLYMSLLGFGMGTMLANWCVGCEELVQYVICVCVWLGAAWVESRMSG